MSADPFAALEKAAKRQAAEEKAADQVQKALVKLILGKDASSPFFATLALRLRMAVDWEHPTAATNGRTLRYNPDYVCALTMPETIGLLAHEVMHNAGKHFARRAHRDQTRWNVACDLEINPVLREAGATLPDGAFLAGEGQFTDLPKGENAERYYELLPDKQDGAPNPDPGGCGAVEDAGDKAQQEQAAAEQDVATVQAAEAAKGRGELPGGLDRLVQSITSPKVDWRNVLREYVSAYARNDYAWTPPNRRFVHQGLYLPSVRSEELGDVVLAVDTSGSIGQAELDRFAAEAQGIFSAYNCSVTIVYHDSRVQKTEHWEATDGDLRLNPVGGGGTDHCPVFAHIHETGSTPTVLVALTDMDSRFPDTPPPYPVIWARIGGGGRVPCWGQLVEVD